MSPLALSVKVIVNDSSGRVLLLRRAPSSKRNAGKWEFPGGKVDPGEAFDEALRRELAEETGLEVAISGSFATEFSELPEVDVVHLVLEGRADGTEVRLSSEHDEHDWVEPSDLEDVELAPHFRRIARRYSQDVRIHPRVAPVEESGSQDPDDLFADHVATPSSLEEHLLDYRDRQGDLEEVARRLEGHLRREITKRWPLAEVGARAKKLHSFAAKIIRKDKYRQPLHDMTDLVGARVMLHLESEVDQACRWIERSFEVDRANSEDKLEQLGAERFGYRSVHYVVVLRREKLPGKGELPGWVDGLKAEIQVRTIAQHAWADIGHDRIYKADCEIPDYWKREANRIAALLEAVDDGFGRLVEGIDAYQSHSPLCPDEKTARRLLALWDTARRQLPGSASTALRVARLATELEDWEKVIETVDGFEGTRPSELLTAKGYAQCRLAGEATGSHWNDGVSTLEEAAAADPTALAPRLRLGELLTSRDRRRALRWYEEAFDLDPADPAALAGYIRCKVLEEKSAAFVPLLQPDIERAIERSRDIAAAGADIPDSFYRIAGFLLLLGAGHGDDALMMFARAVHHTRFDGALVQALEDVSQLAKHFLDRMDIECARRFLGAALRAKFPERAWPKAVPKPTAKRLARPGPIVIVAGGCDARYEDEVKTYHDLLVDGFRDFEGTIISGGTREGISGLVGDLAEGSGGRIRALGYLPGVLPDDGSAVADENRFELRYTEGEGAFTALEPIQNWLDILASGIEPAAVRVLGINGGNVAGLEYRLAVALGARVGVIEGSGREAENVAKDWPSEMPLTSGDEWPAAPPGRLLVVPPDAMTIRAFLQMDRHEPSPLSSQAIEAAARALHEDFLEQQRYAHPNPVMRPWPELREDLKRSNRGQIEYLISMLRSAGFEVRPFEGLPEDPRFTDEEVRRLGEMEHGRWNVERLLSGWRPGRTKDVERRISPYIAPFESLDPEVQGYDLENVRLWPELLAEIGYEIVRTTGSGH